MSDSSQSLTFDDGAHQSGALKIEQHGIDFIPESDRGLSLRDLFMIWFGANVIYLYIVDGAIIVGFGLSFWPAMSVVLTANLLYVLLGLNSVAGPRAGTAMLTISRASFGIRGNKVPSFLSWFTAVGWEAVNIVIGTLSLVQLVELWGMHGGTGLELLCLAIIILLTFSVTIFGHAMITQMNKLLSYGLGLGTLVLGIYIIPHINLHTHPQLASGTTGLGAWLLAFLIIASAPISWLNCAADYSRYLPTKTPGKKIVLWVTLGGAIPSFLIAFVGVAASTETNMSNPIGGLQHLLPGWFFGCYLAVIVGGTVTNNFLNTYSSSMSLLTLGLKMKRYKAVFIDATVGTALSVYAIFVSNFINSFINFLSLTVLWLVPWGAIYLADTFLRKGRFSPEALHAKSGPYWYHQGWNISATVWLVLGIAISSMFSNNTLWHGYFVNDVGGGDLSIFVGFVVTGAGYYLTVAKRFGARRNAETRGNVDVAEVVVDG
jgi:NCS1 family nucleobase:cation symporter-1